MTIAAIAYYLFTFFNSLRIVSYLPQIWRVARDTQGASCISYMTWMLWTAANASTSLYAFANLGDLMLGLVTLANTVCCLAVIGLTLFKRRQFQRHREREDMSVAGIVMPAGPRPKRALVGDRSALCKPTSVAS
jgi:hypothetical protein